MRTACDLTPSVLSSLCSSLTGPAPPPPNLFTRSTSAPRTVPPPLPTIAKLASLSISQSSSSSLSQASYNSTSHSRHSSNSNLTSIHESVPHGLTDDRLPSLSIEESKDVIAIEEETADEEQKTMEPSHLPDAADDEEADEPSDDASDDEDGDGDDDAADGYRLSEEEPSSLHINGDLPVSPMSAVSTPLGRAFAIFGREIRHVSPNTSLSLPTPPITSALPPSGFAKRTPRTVPPPLPRLSNGGVRPPATSLTVPSPISAGPPPEAVSPLSPLQSPLSPVTPSPSSPPPVKAFSPAHSRAPSLPSSPTPGAASPPPLPTTPQTRSAASSLTQSSVPKVRSSLPPGFQFPLHRLAAEAAKAAGGAPSPVMSASSPIQTSATPESTPPLDLGHSATAPSALAIDPTRPHATPGSEPTTPRRGQAATMCPPPQVRDPTPEVVRPATAGARSDEGQAAWGRTGFPGLSAIAEGGGAAKQKCIKCVSFSVRGAYCLKHLYYAGLSALAAAPATPAAPLPRLSQTLNPSSAASTAQMLRIADELLKTEKSYYESLRVAYRTFQQRLEVAAAFAENPQELTSALSSNVGGKGAEARGNALSFLPVLTSVEIGTIFSKLHDIFTLSSNLYHDLTTLNSIRLHADPTVDDPQGAPGGASLTLLLPFLGSTLLHYSSYFRVYQSYLENYDDAIKTLVQLRSTNVALDVFLTWQEKCEATSLDSLLIMPVQRLPRYLLLLQEIIKIEEKLIVERQTHPGTLGLFHHYPLAYHDILTAREKISRIADAINSSLHVKESVQVVAHLQSLFENDSKFVPFATPTRQLVKEGVLKKINETRKNAFLGSSSTYHFFLFNDLFLYAEELRKLGGVVRYRMKYTIPLLDLTLLDGGDGGGKGNQLRLRNEGSGKNLTVQCKSVEERDEWQGKIEEMQKRLKELTQSMHVMTFDGNTPQQKKERSNMNKAKMMMGIGAN